MVIVKQQWGSLLFFGFILTLHAPGLVAKNQKPPVVIAIVIDQFAYHYIPKLSPYFQDGLKSFFSKGVVYHEAQHPHGVPVTSTGHTAIGTGAFAKEHGVILNDWTDKDGNVVAFSEDNTPESAVFGKQGPEKYGRSAKHIMTDGLSDQIMIHSKSRHKNQVFALSIKDVAAIGLAGHLGKPLWFDSTSHIFTSSKAFFETVPDWVTRFNREHDISKQTHMRWNLAYPATSRAYKFVGITDYDHATPGPKLAGKTIDLANESTKIIADYNGDKEIKNSLLIKTPFGNALTLEFAKACLRHNYSSTNKGRFMLWVSLSSLDIVGHEFGPESLEVIDMIYHLDRQLGSFIRFVKKHIGLRNVLFVLTADHGVTLIPERATKLGYSHAGRIDIKDLKKKINTAIDKKFHIKKAIARIKTNQIFLNHQAMSTLTPQQQSQAQTIIKYSIEQCPGIKKVWTYKELSNQAVEPWSYESFYKNQSYPGRTGDLITMPHPYCLISQYDNGAAHRTPYDSDTHVPLVLYQKKRFSKKQIYERVWMPQLAGTLAQIIRVPRPSTAHTPILSGLM